MNQRTPSQDFYRGVRACIAWLHAEALTMNDPHARSVLNNAAFHLGIAKPDPLADTPVGASPRQVSQPIRDETQ